MPATLDICIKGATIWPTRLDGGSWQPIPGDKKLSKDEQDQLDGAFSKVLGAFSKVAGKAVAAAVAPASTAATAVADVFAPAFLQSFGRTRVYGYVTLARKGNYPDDGTDRVLVASDKSPLSGNYRPAFDACFKDVPWNPDMGLLVHLMNKHEIRKDDIIGDVKIPSRFISAAYAHQVPVQANVSSQGTAIKLVGLDVSKGASSAK